MKIIDKIIPLPQNPYLTQYFHENCVFFDIETTGFSPKTAFVYLIGMVFRKGNQLYVHQFLAENRSDEKDILSAFYQQLTSFDTLITFNGIRFDIPFLKERGNKHTIHNNWDSYQSIDLYKLTGKLAHLFQLPDKKQKSLERFLGIHREDLYNGGELISVYYEYEKTKNSHEEELLLLHNYEDVLGMTELLSLLAYRDLFAEPVHVKNIQTQTHRPYNSDMDISELLLDITVKTPFPKKFLYRGEYCTLRCEDTSVRILINIISDELKFYYDNYKDYYYLPEEDMAIHKSVASFVDTAHRKKATATTCYTKKTADFLPQKEAVFTPCFYTEKKSGNSYFELTEAFLTDKTALNKYAMHLLNTCLHA